MPEGLASSDPRPSEGGAAWLVDAPSSLAASMAERAAVAMFVAGADGIVAWANAAAANLVVPGQRWDRWLEPATAASVTWPPAGPVTLQVDATLGGRRRLGLLSLEPLSDGVAASLTDVTELAVVQDALARRESEHQLLLREVTASSPVGIFALRGATWTYANPRLQQITGLGAAQLGAGGMWDLIRDEDRPQLELDRARWTTAVEPGRSPTPGAYRLRRPDGDERWIRLHLARSDHPDGDSWVGTVEDATEQVLAQQRTELLATVVSATTDMVAIFTPDGRLRFLNPAGRAMLGVPRSDGISALTAPVLLGESGWHTLREHAMAVAAEEGTWSGEGEVRTHSGRTLPVSMVLTAHRDGLGRVERLSLVARDASGHKAIERRLTAAATQDALTGLPNRSHFDRVLQVALAESAARGQHLALLFCDLDRFKAVNDELGHAAGDAVLQEVARRLAATLRPTDIAARIGGDEFLVAVRELDRPDEAVALAELIRRSLSRPVLLDSGAGHEVRLSCSIGVAMARDGDDVTQLVARSDQAMYRAKHRGKDRVELDPADPVHPAADGAIAQQTLRAAIDRGGLRLVHQPIVDLRSGQVVAAESLVRWDHPERGVLPAGEFIGLAEGAGLARTLCDWVLRTALRDTARWAADPAMPTGLGTHVTMSIHQLQDDDLPERVAAALRAAGVPATSLCLEVGEAAVWTADPAVVRQLRALRALGVRIGLHHFGSGSSSLAKLRGDPVEVLKLDAALIHGLTTDSADSAIVATIQSMADALGLMTVATGIERPEQVQALRTLGCSHGQGWGVAHPVDADAFAEIARGRRRPSARDRGGDHTIVLTEGSGPTSHPMAASGTPAGADAQVNDGRDVAEQALAGRHHPGA